MKNCFLVNSISLWRLHLAIESAASQSLYFITCKSLWTNSYRVENEFSSQPEVNGEEKDEFATPWNLCRVSIFSTTDRNLPWSKTFPWNVVGKSLNFVLRQATRLLYCFWSFLLIEIFLKILLTAVVQITTFYFRYTDMVFNNRLDFISNAMKLCRTSFFIFICFNEHRVVVVCSGKTLQTHRLLSDFRICSIAVCLDLCSRTFEHKQKFRFALSSGFSYWH